MTAASHSRQEKGLLEQFEVLLDDYLYSALHPTEGPPKVDYFAVELHLSTSDFGYLIKKAVKNCTGIIHRKLISLAKEKAFDENNTTSGIAYELDFKYPQLF